MLVSRWKCLRIKREWAGGVRWKKGGKNVET